MREVISNKQGIALTVFTIQSTTIIRSMILAVKQDVWISIIIATIFTLLE